MVYASPMLGLTASVLVVMSLRRPSRKTLIGVAYVAAYWIAFLTGIRPPDID